MPDVAEGHARSILEASLPVRRLGQSCTPEAHNKEQLGAGGVFGLCDSGRHIVGQTAHFCVKTVEFLVEII